MTRVRVCVTMTIYYYEIAYEIRSFEIVSSLLICRKTFHSKFMALRNFGKKTRKKFIEMYDSFDMACDDASNALQLNIQGMLR